MIQLTEKQAVNILIALQRASDVSCDWIEQGKTFHSEMNRGIKVIEKKLNKTKRGMLEEGV